MVRIYHDDLAKQQLCRTDLLVSWVHSVVESNNAAAKQNTYKASAWFDPSSEGPWFSEKRFLPEELLLAGGLLWKWPCRLLVDKHFGLPSSRFASLCYNGGSDVTICVIWMWNAA